MVTILVSTMNRSDFLERFLRYYAAVKYKHWIYIGDASNDFHTAKAEKVIKELGSVLNIRYFKYPDYSNERCIKKIIDEVETPYAVYSGDDDFLIPAGIDKCIEFLEKNGDYAGANGKGFSFILKDSEVYGEFASTGKYMMSGLYNNTAAQRLDWCSNPHRYFVTLFSVCRVEVWKEMYKNVLAVSDAAFAGELLPCFIAFLEGKVKHIDVLYLGRQIHKRRVSLLDIYDWIVNRRWNSSYQMFFDSLVEGLVHKDGIDRKSARDIVKQALWKYISIGLSFSFQRRYVKPQFKIKSILKESVKNVPCFNIILNNIKKKLLLPFSLASLLNSRSPYYKDFISVYNHVLNGKLLNNGEERQ